MVSGELERNPSIPPPLKEKIEKDRPQDASHASMCLFMLVTEKGNTPLSTFLKPILPSTKPWKSSLMASHGGAAPSLRWLMEGRGTVPDPTTAPTGKHGP